MAVARELAQRVERIGPAAERVVVVYDERARKPRKRVRDALGAEALTQPLAHVFVGGDVVSMKQTDRAMELQLLHGVAHCGALAGLVRAPVHKDARRRAQQRLGDERLQLHACGFSYDGYK